MNTTLAKNGIPTKMTDDEFFAFCVAHKDWRIERNSNLEVVIMAPTGSDTGRFENEVGRQLGNWSVETNAGEVFGPSSGFTLPDNSVRSPDVCWIASDRLERLPAGETEKFAHICPDFVIEVYSRSDQLVDVQEKMKTWLANGCKLAWLIDPTRQTSSIYRPGHAPEKIEGFDRTLAGEHPVEGFARDLSRLKTKR